MRRLVPARRTFTARKACRPAITREGSLVTSTRRVSRTPRRRPARVALQARPVPHQREVRAFGAGFAHVALHLAPRRACRPRTGPARGGEGGEKPSLASSASPTRAFGAVALQRRRASAVAPVRVARGAGAAGDQHEAVRACRARSPSRRRWRARRRGLSGRLRLGLALAERGRGRSPTGRHGRGRCGRDRRSRARGRRSRGSRSRS